MLDYAHWEKLLVRSGMSSTPSEVHGCLCGYLASGAETVADWLGLLDEEFAAGDVLAQECRSALHDLFAVTSETLRAAEFGLGLLLPDDDQALMHRVQALRAWCDGFLYGVGASRVRDWQERQESLALLHDIEQISHAEMEGEGETEERAYAEIVEFLRLAVLSVYLDLVNVQRESTNAYVH